jgi:hypothetical protein
MGAVAAQQPAVMERKYHRGLLAHLGKGLEVEVVPMEVMALHDVRLLV